MKKSPKLTPGMRVVPNLLPLTIKTASSKIRAGTSTKWRLFEITHVFPDDDVPERTLFNLAGQIGSYHMGNFHPPNWFDLCACKVLKQLRAARESLWSQLGKTFKTLAHR